MAKKYKISESNLKEFFGLFGKKDKPKQIQHIIDNDPVLKSIDKKISDMDKNATQNMVKKYPDMKQLFQKYGYNKFD
jgi:hypothetical protein